MPPYAFLLVSATLSISTFRVANALPLPMDGQNNAPAQHHNLDDFDLLFAQHFPEYAFAPVGNNHAMGLPGATYGSAHVLGGVPELQVPGQLHPQGGGLGAPNLMFPAWTADHQHYNTPQSASSGLHGVAPPSIRIQPPSPSSPGTSGHQQPVSTVDKGKKRAAPSDFEQQHDPKHQRTDLLQVPGLSSRGRIATPSSRISSGNRLHQQAMSLLGPTLPQRPKTNQPPPAAPHAHAGPSNQSPARPRAAKAPPAAGDRICGYANSVDNPCPVPTKEYPTTSTLNQHMRTVHGDAYPVPCNEPRCTQRFQNTNIAKKHEEKSHNPDHPHECEACGKRFPEAASRRSHMYSSCVKAANARNNPGQHC